MDPLAEQQPGKTPYHYCSNNPVSRTDPTGMIDGPGDKFITADDAAKDFASLYNDNSINDKKEYGAVIYEKTTSNGNKFFSYTVPNISSSEDGVVPMPDLGNENTEIVAGVHTHSNYDVKYKNDVPSQADKDGAKLIDMNAYIATPKGELLKYDVKSNVTSIIDKNVPSDINHPNRSNNINSSILPKNEPTRGTGKIIFDNIIVPILRGASSIKN